MKLHVKNRENINYKKEIYFIVKIDLRESF